MSDVPVDYLETRSKENCGWATYDSALFNLSGVQYPAEMWIEHYRNGLTAAQCLEHMKPHICPTCKRPN